MLNSFCSHCEANIVPSVTFMLRKVRLLVRVVCEVRATNVGMLGQSGKKRGKTFPQRFYTAYGPP